MSRRIPLVSLACAVAVFVAMPALADPAPPAPPDGGADYVVESGPTTSHTWTPSELANSGLQNSSAAGKANSFSTGAGAGQSHGSSAQSLVLARKKAKSDEAAGGSSAAPAATVGFASLLAALEGGEMVFSSGGKPIFDATLGDDGSSVTCNGYDDNGNLQPDGTVTISATSLSGTSQKLTIVLDKVADNGYTLNGTFSSQNGSSEKVTGALDNNVEDKPGSDKDGHRRPSKPNANY